MNDDVIKRLYAYVNSTGLHKQLGLSSDYRLSFLAQGEYNQNYILEDNKLRLVLRVNYGSQINTENQIEYEFNTLKLLSDSGVTPKPIFVDGSREEFDQGLLVMEYLAGQPLNYEQHITQAANIFASIHSIKISPNASQTLITETQLFKDRIDEAHYWLKSVWSSPYLQKDSKQLIEQALQIAESNQHQEQYFIDNPLHCINNTEVNSHNFIISPERSSLVDWEKAVISDPCQDLTHFLAVTTTRWKTSSILSTEQQDVFFSSYEAAAPELKSFSVRERVNLYKPYLNLRAISWCAYAYVEYQNPDRAIKNNDTYQKIKTYLEPDFLAALFELK